MRRPDRPWPRLCRFVFAVAVALLTGPVAAQDVYAPFSGAIYIIGVDGVQIAQPLPAYCPVYAALSCSGIGYPDWCCPADYICQYLSFSSVVGCCPVGSACTGSVSPQSISTVTVTVIHTQTQVVGGGVGCYVLPGPTAAVHVGAPAGEYCSTLVADGPGLPTTRAGACGTILVVSDARDGGLRDRHWYAWAVPAIVAVNALLGAWLYVGGAVR